MSDARSDVFSACDRHAIHDKSTAWHEVASSFAVDSIVYLSGETHSVVHMKCMYMLG